LQLAPPRSQRDQTHFYHGLLEKIQFGSLRIFVADAGKMAAHPLELITL
jgi:hypothetical protein